MISLRGLTKSYPGAPHPAVSDLMLEVPDYTATLVRDAIPPKYRDPEDDDLPDNGRGGEGASDTDD